MLKICYIWEKNIVYLECKFKQGAYVFWQPKLPLGSSLQGQVSRMGRPQTPVAEPCHFAPQLHTQPKTRLHPEAAWLSSSRLERCLHGAPTTHVHARTRPTPIGFPPS